MATTSGRRMRRLMACFQLLVASFFAERAIARPASSRLLLDGAPASSRTLLRSNEAVRSTSLRRKSTEESMERVTFPGVAFLHRSRRATKASCKASSSNHRRDEPPAPLQMNPRAWTSSSLFSLESILFVRGGDSSSDNNAAQNILKSILASQSLPAPIKQLIEMICRFFEKLTGCKVLPRVGKKTRSKAKIIKSNEREVLVEEVNAGAKKKRSAKRKSDGGCPEEVKFAPIAQKKKKRRTSEREPAFSGTENIKATTPEKAPPSAAAAPPTKPKRPDAASKKFLSNNIKSSNPNYRIQRELKEFLSSPPPGLSVKISGKNVRLWVITLSMPENTIYAGETYRLRVQFPNDYPTSPPSVYFLNPTPRHEHVYTNGDICLSLLGKDWRPIMTASSVAQAIMSILCGAQRKSLPMDNARHAGNKPGKKQDDWVYHDDNC